MPAAILQPDRVQVLEAARCAVAAALEAGEESVVYGAAAAANEALADGVWRRRGGGSGGDCGGGGDGSAAAEGEGESESEGEGEEAAGAERGDEMSEAARRALVALVTAEALESAAALGPTALLGAQGGAADAGAANASLRGAWHYRVGLVGKPSAGKPPRAERLQPFRCRPARPRRRAPSVA